MTFPALKQKRQTLLPHPGYPERTNYYAAHETEESDAKLPYVAPEGKKISGFSGAKRLRRRWRGLGMEDVMVLEEGRPLLSV